MTYADTSFLASAYGDDANTVMARRFIAEFRPRLPFAFLPWPELVKSFWTSQPDGAEQLWELVEEDLGQGQKLYLPDLDADDVARRAAGLMKNIVRAGEDCVRWTSCTSAPP